MNNQTVIYTHTSTWMMPTLPWHLYINDFTNLYDEYTVGPDFEEQEEHIDEQH